MKIISADSLAHGRFEGASDGPAGISMVVDESGPGDGPRRHRHPYDETWVIQAGNLLFQVGNKLGKARPGDIVLAPPWVPHKFTNHGRAGASDLHPRQPDDHRRVSRVSRPSYRPANPDPA